MTLRRLVSIVTVLAALAPLSLAACSDDDEEEHADDGNTHEPESPSCVELTDVCHEADTGSGPAHDCHEVAHGDVEADCLAELEDCTAICEAVINDGGM
jgi:hypothetical protein